MTPLAQDYARTQKLLIKREKHTFRKKLPAICGLQEKDETKRVKFMMVDILNPEEQKTRLYYCSG